jgi:hypothetical protein
MRRAILLGLALVVMSVLAVQTTAAKDKDATVLRFKTMTGVVEPFTGAPNPIRGLNGGGLPWVLDRASGRLRSDGRIDVRVEGLVLARRAPVPANLQGTNPIKMFQAIVSCLTPASGGTGVSTVNLRSALVPASADGDARIRDRVALPSPCIAPIVFVTSPADQWFASTGA